MKGPPLYAETGLSHVHIFYLLLFYENTARRFLINPLSTGFFTIEFSQLKETMASGKFKYAKPPLQKNIPISEIISQS